MSVLMRGDVAEIGIRLLDGAHMAWLLAQVESEHALHGWFEATARQEAAAYLAYRAALDREEAAAYDLQRLSEVAPPCRERLARDRQAASTGQAYRRR
jgi:hypothetical protein